MAGRLPFSSLHLPLFIEHLRRRGLSAEALLERHAIPAWGTDTQRVTLDLQTFRRVMHDLGDLLTSEVPALSLLADDHKGIFGLPEYLFRTAGTIREAGWLLPQFGTMINDAVEFTVEESDAGLAVHHRVPGVEGALGRHGNEYAIIKLVQTVRELLAQPVTPLNVWFAHAHPESTAALTRFLGVEPEFGASSNGFLLSKEVADEAIVSRDPDLNQLILRELEPKRSPQGQRGFLLRVEKAIEHALNEHSACTLDAIADTLRMSSRTLQRRLDNHGVGFVGLLEAVRFRLAERLLADEGLGLSEVAFRLGYSGTAPFVRAFRRWRGVTPGKLRATRATLARGVSRIESSGEHA